MANYTGPDPNRLLPGEPWASDLALAAFEDPLAIAEGAANAPRIAQKVILPTGSSPTITFSGFSGWQGVIIHANVKNTGGTVGRAFSIALGDASTVATSTTIFTVPVTTDAGGVQMFVDFSDGSLASSYGVQSEFGKFSSTLALPVGPVTRVVITTESSEVLISGMAIANGGEATS